jgi:hypothetical protein
MILLVRRSHPQQPARVPSRSSTSPRASPSEPPRSTGRVGTHSRVCHISYMDHTGCWSGCNNQLNRFLLQNNVVKSDSQPYRRVRVHLRRAVVGLLYKLNPVQPIALESAWFQPLKPIK